VMVDALMIRAHTAIASAQVLLDAGDFAGAINRAYYAMFYAARAALQHVGIEVASSKHGTLVSRFGQHLIKAGHLPDDLGRWLNRMLELRAAADYGEGPPARAETEEALARATRFLEAIEAFLAG
jgi:uncharacterized protein (UPF0332 family)